MPKNGSFRLVVTQFSVDSKAAERRLAAAKAISNAELGGRDRKFFNDDAVVNQG